MSNIITRPPWTRQPQFDARANPGDSLAQCLNNLWLPHSREPVDVISGLQVRGAPSGVSIGADAFGKRLLGSTSAASATVPTQSAYPFVIVAYGSMTANNFWVFGGWSGSGALVELGITDTGKAQLKLRRNFGTTRTLLGTQTLSAGTQICVIAQVFSATDYRLYANGEQVNGTLDFGSGGTWLTSQYTLASTLNGSLHLLGAGWGRGSISDDRALAISRSPSTELWKLFAPASRRIWVPVSAASGSTIAAATGAATASALTGASTAATTPASASGAASAQALAGSAIARGAITAATGAATASTMVGGTATGSTISSAAGAATASALAGASTSAAAITAAAGTASASAAGASTAAAAIGAAAGASTAADMVGVAGQGSTIGVAAGASTASAMAGASIVSASFGAAAGAASAQIVVGAAFAQAAIGSAAGVASAAAMVGGVTGGTASAAEVWAYVMSNGYTAEENVVAIRSMLEALTPAVIAEEVLHNALV